MDNPFFKAYTTAFETPPFEEIKTAHYLPAVKEGIKKGKAELEQIIKNKALPTFENTIIPLEECGSLLERVTTVFFNLNSAETNDEIQALAQEISPLLSQYSNDITLNEALFKKVKYVYENKHKETLDEEQEMLLTKAYKSFARNGANLNEEDKKKLRSIDEKLSKLSLQFGENVLAETNAYQLWIENENDLAGIPDMIKATYKTAAAMNGNEKAWLITLDYPSYIPFMTYAENRALRKKLSAAFGSRAFQSEHHDNRENIKQIISLRKDRANLLGYKTHAHFVLEERMARDPETVFAFLEELKEKALPVAKKEKKELDAFAEKFGINDLQKYDGSFYSEKLKKEKYDLDEEMLKPYFELDAVANGVFEVATKLYGITFTEVFDIQKYHEDVKTYEVKDLDGNHIAIFYTDYHPRSGKRPGAWMTSYRGIWNSNGTDKRPHVSIVCNFTKPTKETPSLLTFNEVRTLFHEFGHALHGMLGKGKYKSLTGTNVYWDFVELPSQIMENWCLEKEVLDMFAKHYKTGELIPENYIAAIKKSASFQEGMATLRQLSFGTLDMMWHTDPPITNLDVAEAEKAATASFELYPTLEGNCMSTAFSHIFQGGYSAGYYSYKWAEVLDADAFEFFKEKGIFNQNIAHQFKTCILEKGGTIHPMDLYVKFRGKKPDTGALLRRSGLLKK